MFVGELLTAIDILAKKKKRCSFLKPNPSWATFLLNLEVLDNEMLKPIYMLMFNLPSKLFFQTFFENKLLVKR